MDKVIICPSCSCEIINHECERCEDNAAQIEALEQQKVDNYIYSLMGAV